MPVCNSIVAMIADLWCHLTYNSSVIHCMPCSYRIISEMTVIPVPMILVSVSLNILSVRLS